jgi:hypothetical protein
VLGRQREILEGTADEDAGRPDACGQRAATVDDQHVEALQRQQPSGVQTGQTGPDNEYVHHLHTRRS